MAMFMTANNLTPQEVVAKGDELSFPESVIGLFKGNLGQPYQGFPDEISKVILKNTEPISGRANDNMDPVDFDKEFEVFQSDYPGMDFDEFLSFKLYPKVFEDYVQHLQKYGEVTHLPTTAFFYGMKIGEEILIELSKGKTIIIELVGMTDPDELGMRAVAFRLNGQIRRIAIKDKKVAVEQISNKKAEADKEVGSPLQGKIAEVKVKVGDVISKDDVLFIIEAMKMETTVSSNQDGKVKKIHLEAGKLVEQDDLIIEFE